ncbi:hypothetical protein P170DRAFT_472876 [Aspergillus steynii IBT 23096]|uniref:Zinc finger Mcm10/DnaG-type domain-containing protein n=1 Tax=Aspergillus steynii IBT 23096 TaxID=1392250 RepID=A0A2I2GJE3_9EURO|nr:uncharacterized protein P170DRAFT_472876 [Aspergillus steynii IBT 23096]PLB52996.1 hypothetical protein P170DRAFT_472876 [Aspergillus steynii IBT 23096]
MVSMVETSWPPKSPREALLSSPSGRRKFQEMQRRGEVFGSPLKHSSTTPNLRSKTERLLEDGVEDLDEDEDEETLQLKLAAIQARLKLKQLQKSRGKSSTPGPDAHEENEPFPRPASSFSSRAHDFHTKSQNTRLPPDEVQVPLSPTRRLAPAADPVSPRRIILGDKGRKASDVSLKRPPPLKSTSRPTSRLGSRDGPISQTQSFPGADGNRPKSFSERMAESRSADKLRKERAERLQVNRSSAFQFDKNEVEGFKAAAAEARAKSPVRSPTRNRQAESFSREDVLRSYHDRKPPALKRSLTAPSAHKTGAEAGSTASRSQFHKRNHNSESGAFAFPDGSSQAGSEREKISDKAPDASKFEAFSSLHLSNRILPHSFLSRTLADKKVLQIPDLLRTVKGPAFELPEDVDCDFVVFGIVASKSDPKEKKESKNISGKEADPFDDGLNNSNRYMVITLTDLKWSIDLFLFDTAFPRYYRLSEGILVAILNPTIMPPPRNKLDTNKFSLALSSSDDTVLEVGYAQDIGFCKAVRKDGKTCHSWVDGRKTEFCDFHVDLQVRRTQSQRMGVNGGTGMFGPGGSSGTRTGFWGGGKRGGTGAGAGSGAGNRNGLKPNGAQYDMQTQSTYYVAPAPKSGNESSHAFAHRHLGQSAASLIDADDDDPFIAAGMMGRGAQSKEEKFRKRLMEQRREREIIKKLSASRGPGIGSEYMRARNAENVPSQQAEKSSQDKGRPAGASQHAYNLGLMGVRRADNVKLTPLKRTHDGDRPHGSGVKKTRFITAKGIKEAGRDSLGGQTEAVNQHTYDDDDDDDDLEII